MKNGFFVLWMVALCSACSSGTAKEDTAIPKVTAEPVQPEPQDNIAKEVFSGTLPCVDCDSIQTVIALKADSTFIKSTTYMGVKDSTLMVGPQKGKWTMTADTVELLQTNAPNKFIRRDSLLLQLDVLGQPVLNKQGDTLSLKKGNLL